MASAAPRGRSTKATTERNEKKTFVFGSSTPRDLSYMHTVPATLRTYDSKVKPTPRAKAETLAHYMRQARSVTRNQSGSRETSRDRAARATFAFGSSTPRVLSHLYSLNRDYGDAKINPQVGRRSYTTPTLPTTRSSTVPAPPVKVQVTRTTKIIRKPAGTEQKKTITTTTTTTRHVVSVNNQPKEGSEEFMNSVKEKLEAQKEAEKNKAKPVKKTVAKKEPKVGKPAEEKKVPKGKETTKTGPVEEPEKKPTALETAGVGNGDEKVSPIAKPEELLESSVTEDEAKLLSVEAAPAQNIVPQEIAQGNAVTKMTRVESLGDSKIVQVLDEVPEAAVTGAAEDEMTKSYHLGSIEHGDLKDTFSIISKEEHDVEANEESDSADKAEEAEGKAPENSGSEKSELSPGEQHSTVPLAVTSDPGTSPGQHRSPPPSPFEIETVAAGGGLNSNKTSFSPLDSTDDQKGPGEETKDQTATSENAKEEHVVPGSDQHRFPVASETVARNFGDAEAPEKPPHRLPQEDSDAPAGVTGHQIIYNYSYEYRSGEPGSEESMRTVTEESYPSRSESKASSEHPGDSPNKEGRKKSADDIEGVSAL